MGYYKRQQYRKRSEATEQETVIQWCGWHEGKHPELKLIYHVPNGGSRNTLEAANLKRQGVKAGVPDLCLPVPKNGFHGLISRLKRHFLYVSYKIFRGGLKPNDLYKHLSKSVSKSMAPKCKESRFSFTSMRPFVKEPNTSSYHHYNGKER